ncbi:hypothetical protein [uncultured Albimonas sp.]|uniref:hypothetical protein n=1 Tax=uncultured Albimonas sp. TaxID=1331701 RepID=UPI0030EDC0CA
MPDAVDFFFPIRDDDAVVRVTLAEPDAQGGALDIRDLDGNVFWLGDDRIAELPALASLLTVTRGRTESVRSAVADMRDDVPTARLRAADLRETIHDMAGALGTAAAAGERVASCGQLVLGPGAGIRAAGGPGDVVVTPCNRDEVGFELLEDGRVSLEIGPDGATTLIREINVCSSFGIGDDAPNSSCRAALGVGEAQEGGELGEIIPGSSGADLVRGGGHDRLSPGLGADLMILAPEGGEVWVEDIELDPPPTPSATWPPIPTGASSISRPNCRRARRRPSATPIPPWTRQARKPPQDWRSRCSDKTPLNRTARRRARRTFSPATRTSTPCFPTMSNPRTAGDCRAKRSR